MNSAKRESWLNGRPGPEKAFLNERASRLHARQTNWRCQISKMAVTGGFPLDSGFPVSTAVIPPQFSYII
ncbi:unnamed protein product [Boreogadus saida]